MDQTAASDLAILVQTPVRKGVVIDRLMIASQVELRFGPVRLVLLPQTLLLGSKGNLVAALQDRSGPGEADSLLVQARPSDLTRSGPCPPSTP